MTKKITKPLLLLLMIIATFCTTLCFTACNNEVFEPEYTLSDDGTYYIVSDVNFDGASLSSNRSCTIPSTYNGLPVKEIGKEAFKGLTLLKEVIIPDSVTTIGQSAFNGCPSLKEITIPDSVISIASWAFYNCSSLMEVTIGNGVKAIGYQAFVGCNRLVNITNLSTLEINAHSKYIKQSSSLLSSLGINGGTNETDDDIYSVYVGCNANYVYTSVSEESRIIEQNDFIFVYSGDTYFLVNYTGSNTDVTLPDTVNGTDDKYSIYQYAFSYDETIENITISENVTSINVYAFNGSIIKNVTFENTSGWKMTCKDTNSDNYGNTTNITVTDSATNATNLKSTYTAYYWYKN